MEKEEQQFTKGFNSGYLISKFEPELSKKLFSGIQTNNDYVMGIISGMEQHKKELSYPTPAQTKEAATEQKNKDVKEVDIERDHE